MFSLHSDDDDDVDDNADNENDDNKDSSCRYLPDFLSCGVTVFLIQGFRWVL